VDLLIILATALALGAVHAFDADHLAAVSAFAIRRPTPRAALGFGVRWAGGHGGVIVIAGTLLVLVGRQLPDASGLWLERAVGLSLIALGAWTLAGARRLHAHEHVHADGTRHAHVHSHLGGRSHAHGHAVTGIGALHGLAGTAPVVALLPIATLSSAWTAGAYLLLFAAGTTAAMGMYAMLAGWMVGRAESLSQRLARSIAYVTGTAAFGIGAFWLIAA
jgi:nickel/cobalt transporter (NicO) family protein